MTAYLQPGDKIHLAVGVDPLLSLKVAKEQVSDHLKMFQESYDAMGVHIVTITGVAGLLAPVVVAVFREAS